MSRETENTEGYYPIEKNIPIPDYPKRGVTYLNSGRPGRTLDEARTARKPKPKT